MCNCKKITPQTHEAYDQMIVLDVPEHMSGYKSGKVSIDPCIVDEIKYLWSMGITTYGSCCGHNSHTPFVNVDERDIELMLKLGYTLEHSDPKRRDTFRLKINNINLQI